MGGDLIEFKISTQGEIHPPPFFSVLKLANDFIIKILLILSTPPFFSGELFIGVFTSSSSSFLFVKKIGTIMLDAKYPLSGFDDVNFDDSGGGIGPLSGLDESEIGRRLGGGSLLQYQAPVTTPATSHSANKGDESESEAAFSGALETNVTASLGQTAFLRCRLKNSKHQVSAFHLYRAPLMRKLLSSSTRSSSLLILCYPPPLKQFSFSCWPGKSRLEM